MITIVGCGNLKTTTAQRARDLYLGQHFTLTRQAAEALGEPWFILSAQHGLLRPDRVISPYSHRLWRRQSELATVVEAQARWLIGRQTVLALVSGRYLNVLLLALPPRQVRTPLIHLSIGQQRSVLADMVRTGEA